MTDQNTPVIAESGVAFPALTDAEVSVEATFLESGNQLQHLFIGLEPVILIIPEYDADEHEVKFLTTAVDLDPQGLVDVLEVILDGAKEMVRIQDEQIVTDDDARG